MPNYRNDMEFDEGRAESFMTQVNDLLPSQGELPTDSFTANAVLGQYLWKFRPSSPEDENPEADALKEREGWVMAMYLGRRSLREIAFANRMSELRPDQRKRITKDVISETVYIVDQLQRKGENGSRPLIMPPHREQEPTTPAGIKECVEELYRSGRLESEQLAVGIILLTDSVDPPQALAPETIEKLKVYARFQIRSRIETTRAMTSRNEGVSALKRLVGYERDGIAPLSVEGMVEENVRRNSGDRERVEAYVRQQLAHGISTLFQSYIPTTDEHR